MKRIISILFVVFVLSLLTGCEELVASTVTKKYVQEKFENGLEYRYGTKFVVNITSFNENSEKREATAVAYPKKNPSLSFEITGSIVKDYFSATESGSSYHTNDGFRDILINDVYIQLSKKYSFEIGGNADYKKVAANITNYLKQFRLLLNDYKTGSYIEIYFEKKYKRAYIPFSLNGIEISREIIVDESNSKVITDTTGGKFAWQGEIALEEYVKLLANGELDSKIREIRCRNYPSAYGECE